MIHIAPQTTAQQITLPRPCAIPATGDWKLTLRNDADHKSVDLTVTPTVNGMVITMSIALEQLPRLGQYDYELKRGTVVVSSGLAFVGKAQMRPTRAQYNENINTIQYNG